MTDFSDMARGVIESNRYMVLGTADEAGVPWVTPVWYAQSDYRRFIWVSSPDRRHSRNVRARPEVSIVIFDSQVAVGTRGRCTCRLARRSCRAPSSNATSPSLTPPAGHRA